MKKIIMFSIFTIPFISLCSLDEDIDFNLDEEIEDIEVIQKNGLKTRMQILMEQIFGEDLSNLTEKETRDRLIERIRESYFKNQDDDDDKNSSPVLIKPITPIKEENK